MVSDRKTHWDKVYNTKDPHEVSWTQEVPKTSLRFIHQFNLSKSAQIIDIGGGDSKLVDHLLAEGYFNITVLDISKKALEKAKVRLGKRAEQIQWIVSDIIDFKPIKKFDLWHDRATFHFLTKDEEVKEYIDIARKSVEGYLTLATFSDKGPKKCSGLDIRQYSEKLLQNELSNGFQKIHCITEEHTTPFSSIQDFLFCSFKRAIN